MNLRHVPYKTIACAALLFSMSTLAHHSAAMFDLKRQVTVTGTVKEFQFSNPHCFIQLMANDAQGTSEWSIEMGAPAHLLRSGWKPRTLKPGDKVTIVINPLSDGGNGGNYVSGTGPDGKSIGSPT